MDLRPFGLPLGATMKELRRSGLIKDLSLVVAPTPHSILTKVSVIADPAWGLVEVKGESEPNRPLFLARQECEIVFNALVQKYGDPDWEPDDIWSVFAEDWIAPSWCVASPIFQCIWADTPLPPNVSRIVLDIWRLDTGSPWMVVTYQSQDYYAYYDESTRAVREWEADQMKRDRDAL